MEVTVVLEFCFYCEIASLKLSVTSVNDVKVIFKVGGRHREVCSVALGLCCCN